MGKSYRKPYVSDGYKGSRRRQFYKNYANRVVRKSKNVPDGKAYKKYFCSYDISDYNFYVEVKNKDDRFYEPEFWKYTRK